MELSPFIPDVLTLNATEYVIHDPAMYMSLIAVLLLQRNELQQTLPGEQSELKMFQTQ